MTTMTLPPYGVFPPHLERIAQVDDAMPDWQHQLEDDVTRRENYLAWRNKMRKTLSDTIWPYFDRTTRKWEGSATTNAYNGTRLEIDLMIQHLQTGQSQLEIKPHLCNTPEFGNTHLEQFIVEDAPSQPAGINIRDYVCSLTEEQFQRTRNIIDQAYQRKLRNLFWLKREFVRPRPYQCALILGYEQFNSEVAISATHSSFYSGHCLEGIIFSAAVAEVWKEDPSSFDAETLYSLMRYAVDFGDRRVFAGVHYPSDNISSWYLALKLIPHVFENPLPIQQFVVEAIKKHSLVYQLVASEYVHHVELEPAALLLENALNLDPNYA